MAAGSLSTAIVPMNVANRTVREPQEERALSAGEMELLLRNTKGFTEIEWKCEQNSNG
jgi:hypothetical protein